MRRIPAFSSLWPFLIIIICSTTLALGLEVASAGQCLSHQQSLLLQLKNSLVFQSNYSVPWNRSSDCCAWEGVTCQDGRVVGLDLSYKSIVGGLTDNSSLFHFQYLKSLDLSDNNFGTPMPSRFGNLTSLRYLNLADSGFVGKIPIEISCLKNLVILDLSTPLYVQVPFPTVDSNWGMLFQNLTMLEQLYLDRLNISATGKEWGRFFSSSLPNLRVLSLPDCSLSGPIDHSLLKLKSLCVLRLDENDLSAPVPRFIANFSKLTSLELSSCGLYGTFPKENFQVPTLETIDLSGNTLLQGSLPEFSQNNSLQYLELELTSFSGRVPTSINNLTKLSALYLSECHFNGTLPNFMLTKLVYLDLSINKFTGPIPTSLFKVPSLETIDLRYNQFNGQLPEFQNVSSSMLDVLDLSSNNLEGPLPMSMFQLKNLRVLTLSFNKLNGTIKLDILNGLVKLEMLELSHNNLSVTTVNTNATAWSSFPKGVTILSLASCKLNIFPNLKNQPNLFDLDLSDNQIHGAVPNWIWDFKLEYLNLSHNYLVGLQEPYALRNDLITLDLHFNQIRGEIPTLPQFGIYIDLSSNKFYSSIPADNGLTGGVLETVCNMPQLQLLDLSSNNLSGRIPECISAMTSTSKTISLHVLDLQRNNFSGTIPDSFPVDCGLRNLELNGNSIVGQIPKSLAYCTELEVLDLGNNHLIDEFPCFLNNISALRVLILRSNKFHGSIGCSNANINKTSQALLQIIDLACNSFSGELPRRNFFTNWKAMMSSREEKLNDLQIPVMTLSYYESTTITIKGQEMFLVKILTAETCIDFSSNNFSGQIPEELGALTLLYALNLSNNAFSGPIPWSLGKLQSLESLDLSKNKLSGTIPTSLASLTFLSHLNLSFNKLVGMIPSGSQFQTFPANSFMGNQGLYGCPLTTNCTLPDHSPPPDHDKHHSAHPESKKKKIDWNLISVEIGFIVGFASLIGPLVFCKRWRNLYYETIEDVAFKILPLVVLRKWLSWTSAR